MRADTIARLAWYMPRDEKLINTLADEDVCSIPEKRIADILHYANCHKDLQFGWNFAKELAKEGYPFPAILRGDDLFVWRAYNFIKGNEDPTIAGALSLTSSDKIHIANIIRALLITKNATCSFVSYKLGIPEDIIKAYEKLFFNILDRKEDHVFIANLVYPHGRTVEAMEDYLEQTGIGEILLRAGHTKGSVHVLYAAGIGDNPFSKEDAASGADKLDRMFMADGCMYAGLGWLHQRRNAIPITNARLSIQAGKMGRGEGQQGADIFDVGSVVRSELVSMGEKMNDARLIGNNIPDIATIPVNSSK